ncbi:hypothetical protein KPL70_025842 [Citrus sinensis]|nr:hypothetical protein KPL70_025842 [Citrus sinensis]
MIEEASLNEHIDEFNKVCDELEIINEGLSDESKALLLISSLPKSYKHFVDTLLYGRQTLSLEEVKSALGTKKLKDKKNKNKETNERTGNAAIATEKECSFETAGVLIATSQKPQGQWVLDSVGIGTVSLRMFDGVVRELTQVRFVPKLKINLISIGMLDQTGCVIKAEKDVLRVIKGSMVIMKGLKQNGMYVMDGHTAVREASIGALGFCEDCILRKSSKLRFETAAHTTKEKLGYIHSDLWGSAQVNSLDNGLEYCNKLFEEFCEKNGIQRHKTVTYTPQQNGLAERMNKTLVEKVRCMLIYSKLPKTLWVEALNTVCYLVNRSPSTAIDCKTPMELWSGRMADYAKLRIFYCTAYAHVKQGKLEPRALKCRFLGYPEGVKAIDCEPESGVEHESAESEEDTYQLARDKKRRTIRPPKRYAVADLIAYALTSAQELNDDEPMTYQEAITGKNKLEWNRAMDEEMTSLMKNKTWELIENQLRGKQIILALVVVQDMHLEHMDVKIAFLHGELQEEIVMQQPEGCSYDYFVYFKETSGGEMIYFLLYVDDMLTVCHDREEINHLKKRLKREFEMKELGEAKRILGMDIIINRSKKSLFLTQQSYIQKVLVRFGMNYGKQVLTPLASHFKLFAAQCPQTEAEQQKMVCIPYSSAVGSLMYAMVLTRPDISHVVSLVSRFMANPGYEHWTVVQWIMRYLKETLEVSAGFKKLQMRRRQLERRELGVLSSR